MTSSPSPPRFLKNSVRSVYSFTAELARGASVAEIRVLNTRLSNDGPRR